MYSSCPKLRKYFEAEHQACVLRVPRNFKVTMRDGTVLTCAEAAATL